MLQKSIAIFLAGCLALSLTGCQKETAESTATTETSIAAGENQTGGKADGGSASAKKPAEVVTEPASDSDPEETASEEKAASESGKEEVKEEAKKDKEDAVKEEEKADKSKSEAESTAKNSKNSNKNNADKEEAPEINRGPNPNGPVMAEDVPGIDDIAKVESGSQVDQSLYDPSLPTVQNQQPNSSFELPEGAVLQPDGSYYIPNPEDIVIENVIPENNPSVDDLQDHFDDFYQEGMGHFNNGPKYTTDKLPEGMEIVIG